MPVAETTANIDTNIFAIICAFADERPQPAFVPARALFDIFHLQCDFYEWFGLQHVM